MKILVVSRNIPKPDHSSGDRRLLAILGMLARAHEIFLCIPERPADLAGDEPGGYLSQLRALGVKMLPVIPGIYETTIREDRFDIGFFEFFWMAEQYMASFMAAQPRAAVVVDTVDLHFAREELHALHQSASRRKTRNTRRRELLVYSLADLVIAVSREDRERLVNDCGIRHVWLVPNIVPSVARIRREREPKVIFIGNYGWPPNVDAVRWFVDDVWPLVRRVNPAARLMLAGSGLKEHYGTLPVQAGIDDLGHVPDTAPYLDEAAVSVAPIRYGGGMKGKVNEALAHGLPVVTTTVGAQGFEAVNGVEMFIADDPKNFADAVLQLLHDRDLQERMGNAGQQLNERLCSPPVVEKTIRAMVDLCSRQANGKPKRRPAGRMILLHVNRLLNRYHWKNLIRPK